MRNGTHETPAFGVHEAPRSRRESWISRAAGGWLKPTALLTVIALVGGSVWAYSAKADAAEVKTIERRVDTLEAAIAAQTEILENIEEDIDKLVKSRGQK